MKILGVTGGFGTGKTFVASIFRSLGAKVIDADKIAHEVIRKGSPAYKKIIGVFGDSSLGPRGDIDRRKLAGLVFADKKLVKKLNTIVHPEVLRKIREGILKYRKEKVVVIDAPLLVEAGLAHAVDSLVVVKCRKAKQIMRCSKKFRIEKEEISKRIERQIPIKKKIMMADFVIDNSLTKAETKKQVEKLWRRIVWK